MKLFCNRPRWLLLAAAPMLLFFTPYPKYTLVPIFGFPIYQTCGVPFFLAASLSPNIPSKIQVYLRPNLNTLYQVTPREQQGNRWPCTTIVKDQLKDKQGTGVRDVPSSKQLCPKYPPQDIHVGKKPGDLPRMSPDHRFHQSVRQAVQVSTYITMLRACRMTAAAPFRCSSRASRTPAARPELLGKASSREKRAASSTSINIYHHAPRVSYDSCSTFPLLFARGPYPDSLT